jgi:hypothetical protein
LIPTYCFFQLCAQYITVFTHNGEPSKYYAPELVKGIKLLAVSSNFMPVKVTPDTKMMRICKEIVYDHQPPLQMYDVFMQLFVPKGTFTYSL